MARSVSGLSGATPRSSNTSPERIKVGDPAHLGALLARRGGVVAQLVGEALADQLGQQLILADALDQPCAISQLSDLAAGMGDDDLVVIGVGLRIAQQRSEGRKPGARGERTRFACPANSASCTSVPTGLGRRMISSPAAICCSFEVSGPSGTLIE